MECPSGRRSPADQAAERTARSARARPRSDSGTRRDRPALASGCSRRSHTRATSSVDLAIGDYIVSGARGTRGRAGGVAAGPLGRYRRQAHRRVRPRRGAAARIGRLARRRPDRYCAACNANRRIAATSLRAATARRIVIGYSDTNKQAGIAASRWALQVAQIRLLDAARDTGIVVTVVHDRGGTPARGGGRTENLVESAPNGAIRGVLRLTEQGEVVNQSYGLRPIAMRTLERTFAAVVLGDGAHRHQSAGTGAPVDRHADDRGAAALEAYRGLVFGDARVCGVFSRRDPARCDRAHAHRFTPRGSRGRSRHRCAARHPLGFRVDAEPPHAAGLVRIRQRHRRRPSSSTASRDSRRHGDSIGLSSGICWTTSRPCWRAPISRSPRHYDALAGDDLRTRAQSIHREYALTVKHVLVLRGSERLLDRRSDPAARDHACATPMSIPCTSCRWICCKRWRATWVRGSCAVRAPCAPRSAASRRDCKRPVEAAAAGTQHSGTLTASPPWEVSL